MKWIVRILSVGILIAFVVGFYVRAEEKLKGDQIIGISVLATVFVLMPVFLAYSWKGKKLKDYMLTKENMDKMKDRESN